MFSKHGHVWYQIEPNDHFKAKYGVEINLFQLSKRLYLNDAPFVHALREVVEVCEVDGDLVVHGHEEGLALCHFGGEGGVAGGGLLLPEVEEGGVEAAHHLEQILVPEPDLDDALGLEDAAPALGVGVHLHVAGVDGGVDHGPRAPAQLAVGRDVHDDGLLVGAQSVHDVRAELDHLFLHMPPKIASTNGRYATGQSD
jgi:hypothetical protein